MSSRTKYGRSTVDSQPSQPETEAQSWHDEHHADRCESCWCCCRACRAVNPHHADARQAAVNDIIARLADSVSSARLPDPPGKRQRG